MTMTVASQVNADDIRSLLQGLYRELSSEYEQASAAVVDIGRRSDTAGDDEVDAGAKTALREHQLSLMATIQERLIQVERALQRIEAGTYGQCETCGQAISPERLEAFPSATTCVACKRAGERRG
jgi:RNA polymerase-binding transcription factor